MKIPRVLPLLPLFLTGLIAGCSGMNTTMTKMGRLGDNKGYQIADDLSVVQRATIVVLKAHGYQVSVKADPKDGAEEAGQIVIGQRMTTLDAGGSTAAAGTSAAAADAWAASQRTGIRDLVDVYLSKKWQMDSELGAPGITLVNIVGGVYTRTVSAPEEAEKDLTPDYTARLRDEIERQVDAWKNAVTNP